MCHIKLHQVKHQVWYPRQLGLMKIITAQILHVNVHNLCTTTMYMHTVCHLICNYVNTIQLLFVIVTSRVHPVSYDIHTLHTYI